ncbi:MAG TPA: formate--tetrahydrofolate ligase, partial [Cryomorphaceae bacterium]|nr:formate--tetrahydrofolate ligase [Cryomorphaceae bacterium]
ARDLNAQGAMTALLKDAIKPNLVQTLEGTPAIIHGGPFANIAQGTNTVIATKMGMSLSEYTITEAGFGADLGAEKFLDIKCKGAGLNPNAVVIVATIKALKYHGGKALAELKESDPGAVQTGLPNLEKHVENMKSYGIPVIVAINRYASDSEDEINVVKQRCKELNIPVSDADVWSKGGEGARELSEMVVEAADHFSDKFSSAYEWEDSVEDKIEKVAQKIYGADGVDFSAQAQKDLKRIDSLGLAGLPICIAKTQSSLSDNPSLLGRPSDFRITIREIEIAAGAGFVVPIAGNMMRMPGLPATPAAEAIDVDENGNITGLF